MTPCSRFNLLLAALTVAGAASAADPIPTIRANGQASALALTNAAPLRLTVALASDAGDQRQADWWVLADTPAGPFYFHAVTGWNTGAGPAHQGPLVAFSELPILDLAGLPAGAYQFRFGVDLTPDGALTPATANLHTLDLQLLQAGPSDLPDSGQTACFGTGGATVSCPAAGQDLYGQDAQHTRNPPTFQAPGDGTVRDTITGLTWQQDPDRNGDGAIDSHDKLSYAAAVSYCATLKLADQDDWRLPSIQQLYSLIDFRGTDPSIETDDPSTLTPFLDTGYFRFGYGDTAAGERIIDAQYASSTLYAGSNAGSPDGQLMFGVNFADGRIKGYGLSRAGTDTLFYVRCVRGNTAYGDHDLVDHGDGTLSDRATGLMWSQADSGGGLDWLQALAWVAQRNAESWLGHADWRLPNAKELQSILDYGRSPDSSASAAIDPRFQSSAIVNELGQTDYPYYWSSTTHISSGSAPGVGAAVYVAFGRALGYMNGNWVDIHGAGAQRSDPKTGDPAAYPSGRGPQGDAIRIYNHVRLVRDADG